MFHKLWVFLFFITAFSTQLYSQNLFTFEPDEQPETEWALKAAADIQRTAIMMDNEVLLGIRDGRITSFEVQDLSDNIHTVEVQRVIEQLDGDWSITGHIEGEWTDSFIMSYSQGEVLGSFRQVTDHHFLEIRYARDQERHFLMDIDPHLRDELECEHDDGLITPQTNSTDLRYQMQELEESDSGAVIDVMVVYTPAAESWANTVEGGIRNVINNAMAIAQNAADNSLINLQFRLVHQERVNYNETGDSYDDLDNLTFGSISNVHALRDQYGADLVAMFTQTYDVGGIAWLTNNPSGLPDYGFSITRVQQASWGATHAHEMGHNLGSHHSRNQRSNAPSASGGVFDYSTGWRWNGNDGRSYASVMTYEEGSTRVFYFSNPDVTYQGAPTGSYSGRYAPADNARSIRAMKHRIAGYRPTRVTGPTVDRNASSVTISDEMVHANNLNTSTITVIARDADGRTIPGARTRLSTTSGNLDATPSSTITDENGRAEFRVRNNRVENVTYKAVSGNVEINDAVSVSYIGIDPDLSTVISSRTDVQAAMGEGADIEVIARDRFDQPFSNLQIELIPDSGESQIETVRGRTDEEGIALFRVSSHQPESVTYRAEGLGTSINETVTIHFLPAAPVALAAGDVGNRSFIANWELVEGADSYLLDVSEDEGFGTTLPGYDSGNAGFVTSHEVTGVAPGTDYFYKVRASFGDMISAYSHTIGVTTYPDTPVISQATNPNALEFEANWHAGEGARNYRIDVSTDSGFNHFVQWYEDIVVGDQTSRRITGLQPGETYYYRVRSQAGERISGHSDVMNARTLAISAENSTIEQEQVRVLANGVQTNMVSIEVRSEENIPLRGLRVALTPDDNRVTVRGNRTITNQDGIAFFELSSQHAGKAAIQVETGNIVLGTVEMEFLPNDGELVLGENFPNPFDDVTFLPVTIPNTMQVQLQIFDSLGRSVRTVLSESLEPGHYEIPLESHGLSTGVYFYRLVSNQKVMTKKMVKVL